MPTASPASTFRTIAKNLLMKHGDNRAPLCGFAGYVHPTEPRLLRRIGWEIANDIHDDFSDQTSNDNGKTWSSLKPSLRKKPKDGGYICHTENAIQLLPDGRIVHFTNDKFEPNLNACDLNYNCSVRISVGTPEQISQGQGDTFISDFGLKQGICVSFMAPMIDSRGRILVPVQWQYQDTDGSVRRYGEAQRKNLADKYSLAPCATPRKDFSDVMMDVWNVGLLIGEFSPAGKLTWKRSQPVPFHFPDTSRGLCEPTVAELPGGKLAMIIRGSNAHWPDKPGYKWLSHSSDGGLTWSKVIPLPCTDGSLLESSATGSAMFRSLVDGQLYWIGNLCTQGIRPNGNMPRTPLHLARLREDPLAIDRDSITVIDQSQPGENPDTQLSNFKFYQDRHTGDLVLYLTRYGVHGYQRGEWIKADLYEYRVAMK